MYSGILHKRWLLYLDFFYVYFLIILYILWMCCWPVHSAAATRCPQLMGFRKHKLSQLCSKTQFTPLWWVNYLSDVPPLSATHLSLSELWASLAKTLSPHFTHDDPTIPRHSNHAAAAMETTRNVTMATAYFLPHTTALLSIVSFCKQCRLLQWCRCVSVIISHQIIWH